MSCNREMPLLGNIAPANGTVKTVPYNIVYKKPMALADASLTARAPAKRVREPLSWQKTFLQPR